MSFVTDHANDDIDRTNDDVKFAPVQRGKEENLSQARADRQHDDWLRVQLPPAKLTSDWRRRARTKAGQRSASSENQTKNQSNSEIVWSFAPNDTSVQVEVT